ncbi:hypothetical protein B4599_00290 [Xanthomonas oryzae pv. oryzae]|nr:hypothetical protein B4599_00290 [Xanthomonas oryzae pv. oryzae]
MPHARTFFHALMQQVLDLAGRNVGKPQMQAQLRLQLLIIAFNPPSALCRGNQCLDRRLLWSRREPVVAGLGLSRRPLDQQPLLVMCLAIVCGTNPHRREPRTERCVAALAPADLPIRPCGQALRDFMYRDRRMCAIAHRSCAGPTALRTCSRSYSNRANSTNAREERSK